MNISHAALLSLLVSATPMPQCDSGELLVSNGSGFHCATLKSLLEKQRASASWGAENVLPSCSSGDFLQSEGFGRWRCHSPEKLLPSCSSGDTLRAEGSSWRCASPSQLPSCSSGDVPVSQGGGSWSCTHLPH